ncbi:enterobactin synthase [Vibrio anguillarum]|nr:enterobactin synthase [Vibrio anguillarum]
MLIIPNWSSFIQYHQLEVKYLPEYKNKLEEQGISLPSSLNQAVLKRHCEFLAGRMCAKHCLTKLDQSQSLTLEIGKGNQAVWPQNIVGSISHCHGYAIAAATHQTQACAALGIDIEQLIRDEWLSDIRQQVMIPAEHIFAHHFAQLASFITLIFSAKESIYKAIYPWVEQVLDFHVVELIHVDKHAKRLIFQIHTDLHPFLNPSYTISVGYHWPDSEYVLTWCYLSQAHFSTHKK